jgi:cytochrome P450
MALITIGILVSLTTCLVFHLLTVTLPPRRAPKGLRDVPVAGNQAALMGAHPQRQLQSWSREHGELFKVRLGGEQWIFVNSPAAVKEIFDRQSQHSSSRAPSPVVSDLLSGGMR